MILVARREPCAGCGWDRIVNKRTPQGPLCCSCAQPRGECAACGQVRRVPARRSDGAPLCARRILPGRLTALLAEPGHGVPAQLEPLIALLISTPRPSSVLDWVPRRSGTRLLADLAARARCEPVSHQMLDTYPQTPALHHLRGCWSTPGCCPSARSTWTGSSLGSTSSWSPARRPTPPSSGRSPPGTSCAVRARARHRGFTVSAARWTMSRHAWIHL